MRNSHRTKSPESIIKLGFAVAIILFTFVFFRVIHPLIVFDTDDWYYIYYTRRAIPMSRLWNPARVLPEVLMPVVSEMASYTLYPITGDFIGSLATMHALTVTVFIVFYIENFRRVCEESFGCSLNISICCSIFFYIFHFLAFRNKFSDNSYLLYAQNVTCYFYYVIPTLLNASIVMWMIRDNFCDQFFDKDCMFKKGLFILLSYLAVFSNLYCSIIIAAYALAKLIIDYKKPIKGNIIYIFIVAMWVISCAYELSGGRAESVQGFSSFFPDLRKTVEILLNGCRNLNKMFILVVFFAAAALFPLRRRIKNKRQLSILLLAFLFTIAFEILLCTATGYNRINRSDVILPYFMFIFLMIGIILGIVMREYKHVLLIVPLVFLILFSEINTEGKTFIESNTLNINSKTAEAISNNILNQIIAASQSGEDEMFLYVPQWDSDDNWPHATYAASRFSKALMKHGIIERDIEITLKPDLEMREKYICKSSN